MEVFQEVETAHPVDAWGASLCAGGASGKGVRNRQTQAAAAEIGAGYGVRVELRPTLQPTRWVTSAGHFPSSRPGFPSLKGLLLSFPALSHGHAFTTEVAAQGGSTDKRQGGWILIWSGWQ